MPVSSFTRRAPNGGAEPRTATTTATPTATTTQRVITKAGSAKRGPQYGTISVPVKRSVVHETGPLNIRPEMSTPLQLPGGPGDFRFSKDQLIEMLRRGRGGDADTINERSGEPEAGLGPEYDLEQQAQEAGATSAFAREAGQTPPPSDAPQNRNPLGLLALTALGYYFLG